MSDLELIDAVAKKTGESLREIGRRGFILTGPEYAGADLDPECMLDLVDLPETGTVDWDALGFGCREPFLPSTLKARKKAKSSAKKQAATAIGLGSSRVSQQTHGWVWAARCPGGYVSKEESWIHRSKGMMIFIAKASTRHSIQGPGFYRPPIRVMLHLFEPFH